MDNKITELYVLAGFFCILLIGQDAARGCAVVLNISCVIVIILMSLLKYFFKRNKDILNVLELIFIIGLKLVGAIKIELFLPIIIYEIFKFSFINFISILTISFINFYFFKEAVIPYVIYIVLVNLYLHEVDKKSKDTIELKKINKIESANRNMLEEKVSNMYKYIEQKDIVASLKERNYMAQKVHDHLGHRITSAIMQLEVTKATIDNDKETSKKYLLTAMESLRQGMEEIRGFLKHSKPGKKAVSIEEIRKQLLGFQYSTNIKTHFSFNGDISKISTSIFNAIIENLREALTNAAKYSEAKNIYFSINIYNKFIRVEIRDDGIGTENINKSLGLCGMEERIENLGGEVQFFNDGGFVINMIIDI